MTIEKLNEKMYRKHLKNGLEVILMPKKGAIKSYAVFATHFGSINHKFVPLGEENLLTVPDGVAHFLEHKLFEQEDGVNALDKLSKIGANANAYTTFNHTAYLFECTQNFDEALEILLHFVQNPYLTKENVEKEKGIIGQEIKMYDDDPDWQLFFGFLNCLYNEHAITKDIAGTVESIAEITPEILYKCYNTFYDLSNMVLCVVGDFDEEKVLSIIENNVKNENEKEKIHRENDKVEEGINKKRAEKVMDISMPMFMLGFKDDFLKQMINVGFDYENSELVKRHVAIEIIFEMLIGKSTELYEDLYNSGLIQKELGSDYTFEENYAYSSITGESKNVELVIQKILNKLREMKENGIDENELERIKKMLYGEYVFLFNDVSKIGSIVVSDYFKGVNSFDYVDWYRNIQKEDVEKVLKEHFDETKMAVSIVKPQ